MIKVTKIQVQKNNKDRANIFINDEYAFSLSLELVYKEGIKTGQEIDREKISALACADEYDKCKNSALNILERYSKTEKQLKNKLKEKGYREETINKTTEFLKEYNFINDRQYAENFIKAKLKKNGIAKIKQELYNKGIDKNVISEVLENIDTFDEELDQACIAAEKKYCTLLKKENDKYKIKGKLCNFLASRGYNYDIIKKAADKVIKDSDEIY